MDPSPAGASEPGPQLDREWRRWVAASLLDRMALVDVLSVLDDHGIARADSVPYCARLYDDPTFEAGQHVAARLHKIESLLSAYEQMRSLSPNGLYVERLSGVSGERFLEHYYSRNLPVCLTDVCDSWPARSRWTPEYLVDRLGSAEVEVMAGRDADPRYEINSDQHKNRMPFDQFVAKISATSQGNDVYLVANNQLLASPAAAPLWDDFTVDERYLRPTPDHSQAFMWFGPAGTITPLHHDSLNVLFNQVSGRKRVTLIPALSIHRMYNHVAVYSEVDPLAVDADRHPRFPGAPRIALELGPGDSLFIPAGWWHHVEALEASISVSFTNFAWDNSINWVHPDLPG